MEPVEEEVLESKLVRFPQLSSTRPLLFFVSLRSHLMECHR